MQYYNIYGSTSNTSTYYNLEERCEENMIRRSLKPIEEILSENPELREQQDGDIRGDGLVINDKMKLDFGTGKVLDFRIAHNNAPYTHQLATPGMGGYYYHQDWFEEDSTEKVEVIREAKFDPEELLD